MTLPAAIAMMLYVLSIIVFWKRIHHSVNSGTAVDNTQSADSPSIMVWLAQHRSVVFILIAAIICYHGVLLLRQALAGGELNLALGNVFSLVCLMTVVTFMIGAFGRDILNIGVLVMPVGLSGLLVSQFFRGTPLVINNAPAVLWLHLCIALLAFGLLCIAAAQAWLLYIQETQLRHPRPGKLLPALPAIQTMETNLFRLTMGGVILLTFNLATGMIALWQAEQRTLVFNHHVLLSFLAWLGFLGLLIAHKCYGWRGRVAAKWTMFAFVVLVLSFFGSRFVTSIILS